MNDESGPLLVQVSAVGAGHTLVTVHGEIDMDSGPILDDALGRQVSTQPTRLLLDLSSVAFIDSFGLRILVRAERRVREGGGSLQLIAPTRAVERVLRLTGFTLMVAVHDTVSEALDAEEAPVGHE
ncbi:STAS domain-containing protein [Embleya sp. NPDC020630]|uniref:STAS domain-containing protein n=1 Tax=Embleya sp. NPDC020630 TaxID=3363979 RepID=UPI00379A3B1F